MLEGRKRGEPRRLSRGPRSLDGTPGRWRSGRRGSGIGQRRRADGASRSGWRTNSPRWKPGGFDQQGRGSSQARTPWCMGEDTWCLCTGEEVLPTSPSGVNAVRIREASRDAGAMADAETQVLVGAGAWRDGPPGRRKDGVRTAADNAWYGRVRWTRMDRRWWRQGQGRKAQGTDRRRACGRGRAPGQERNAKGRPNSQRTRPGGRESARCEVNEGPEREQTGGELSGGRALGRRAGTGKAGGAARDSLPGTRPDAERKEEQGVDTMTVGELRTALARYPARMAVRIRDFEGDLGGW